MTVEPQPYLEFNYLVRHALGVITDSGGVTEETTVMGVPCVTLRDTTERPETVTVGTNELIGTDPAALQPVLDRLFAGQWKKGGDSRTVGWACRGAHRWHRREVAVHLNRGFRSSAEPCSSLSSWLFEVFRKIADLQTSPIVST